MPNLPQTLRPSGETVIAASPLRFISEMSAASDLTSLREASVLRRGAVMLTLKRYAKRLPDDESAFSYHGVGAMSLSARV